MEAIHSGFLADAGADPRQELAYSLLNEIREPGDIIVYNQSFETTVIQQLAQQLPDEALRLEALLPRIRDLMAPFQKRHYYHPQMNGSYSIKYVLPALVPELTYHSLAISDGSLAMQAYLALQSDKELNRVSEIRSDLWEYCKLDTLGMARILEKLERISRRTDEPNKAP